MNELKDSDKEMIMAKMHDMGLHKLLKSLNVTYVEWGKEFVKFYYNGAYITLTIK